MVQLSDLYTTTFIIHNLKKIRVIALKTIKYVMLGFSGKTESIRDRHYGERDLLQRFVLGDEGGRKDP